MARRTPARFDPDTMARDATGYAVVLPLRQFNRLQPLLADDDGEMSARFRFSRRKDHIVVQGRLQADYPLQCQRCLEPLRVAIEAPFELVFVADEDEARALPDEFDPVVLDENGRIHVVDLFEDELLLHVPTVAKHDSDAGCRLISHEFGELADEEETAKRARPFDILKNLDIN